MAQPSSNPGPSFCGKWDTGRQLSTGAQGWSAPTQGQDGTVLTQGCTGTGVQASRQTAASVQCSGRHYTSQDTSGHVPPSLPPGGRTSCSAPCSASLQRWWGGGSDVAARSWRGEGDPIPGSGMEASEEPPGAAPTAICRLALGPGERVGRWGPRSEPPQLLAFSLIQATNAPRWPPWPRLPLSLRCPRGPSDLEVSSGASRSGPEIGQVPYPSHSHSIPHLSIEATGP